MHFNGVPLSKILDAALFILLMQRTLELSYIMRFPFSTSGLAPENTMNVAEDMTGLDKPHLIADGYGQSKWVAECLVRHAAKKGLPAVVYRLGLFRYSLR